MKFQLSPDLRPDLPDLNPDQEPNLSPALSSAAEMDLDEPAFFTINDDIPIPKSYKAAMAGEHKEFWAAACQAEIDSLGDMKTWILQDLPPGFKAIGTKWVFDIKYNLDGTLNRFKARLVAQGFTQRPGQDYNEVFAPVAKHATIRYIISLAAHPSACLGQLDISTAFLNGVLEEELYCKQPPGFEVGFKACRMIKCLYGLKQASRQWYLQVKSDLLKLGLNEVDADQGLFVLPGATDILLWLVLWVDDFFLLCFNQVLLDKYKASIGALYKTRDLGDPAVFVGYEITRDRTKGTIHICQSHYIKQLLKSANLTAQTGSFCYPYPIPMDPNTPLPYPHKDAPVNILPLAAIVGSLNYLAVCTRPDIAQAVNRLARHSSKPMAEHMAAATGILRYLAGTPTHGILYTSSRAPSMTGFTDSDHASCQLTRKSTTGYVFLNQGGAIQWQSKLQQSSTALSSTEAEYVAASQAAQEALWLLKLKHNAGEPPSSITIEGDNQACLNAWNQDKLSTRLRHLETRYFFLKEEAKKGGIVLSWIPTAANAADMFTKPLPRIKFQQFRTAIGCVAKP